MHNPFKCSDLKLLLALLLAVFGCLVACGGGGSGAGEAGSRAVLRVLNVTDSINNLSVTIDSELAFPQLAKGEASPYESVLEGARLIELFDTLRPELRAELINEFSVSIPYTLILSGSNNSLKTILTLNDRSDSPQGQFRIRAINANSSGSALKITLVPTKVSARVELDATPTAAPTTTVVVTTAPALPTQTVIATVTPTIAAPVAVTDKVLSESLINQQISSYSLLTRGDYKIVIEQDGRQVYSSEAITYNPGQVESIVISNNSESVIRLNDKPN
jgi:hypothetical protein